MDTTYGMALILVLFVMAYVHNQPRCLDCNRKFGHAEDCWRHR